MPIDTHDPTAALSHLAGEIAETIKLYDEIADPGLDELAGRLSAVHEAHAADLLREVETMGGRPEDDIAMMAAVRNIVRGAETGTEPPDGSARFAETEERLVASYDAALEASSWHAEIRELLEKQRDTLKSQIDALRGV